MAMAASDSHCSMLRFLNKMEKKPDRVKTWLKTFGSEKSMEISQIKGKLKEETYEATSMNELQI